MSDTRFSIGQWIGVFIFVICCDGLPLAGFRGGTAWSLILWLVLSVFGGTLGGLLMARSHRVAGLMGGFVAGPMSLLAVYFYARNRQVVHTAETFIVLLIASLPGLGVYFIVRLITNALFPPQDRYVDRPRRRRDDDDDDDDDDEDEDRPRKRRRRREIDDEDEDERPLRGRRRIEDDE